MSEYVLSMSDLLHVDGFYAACMDADLDTVQRILHENGMDMNKHYKVERRLHRNLRKKVVECDLFMGYERTDKEWIATGVASMDAIIESTEDKNLRFTLRTMSKTMSSDLAWGG